MSSEITIEVDGVTFWVDSLTALEDSIRIACEEGVKDAIGILHDSIAEQLRITTHPVGTPTPSVAGSPPSWVTGNLARSINEYGPFWESSDIVSGYVGPNAVYARIQELGGDAGRDHATHLPPRPYVAPAVVERQLMAHSALRFRVSQAIQGA